MKKILAITLALVMAAALSVTAFATTLDLEDLYAGENATTGSTDELIGINFPDGMTFNTGDKVTVHFVGSSDGDFRVWLSHAEGYVTMTPEPIWKASNNGFTSGDFDFTVELEVGDKDGTGQTVADSIIFKAPSAGGSLSNLALSLVEIVDGNDDVPAETETPAEVEAPAETDSPAEVETPAETEEPAAAEIPAETESAPDTGLALAVIPAVLAMAAAIVSKRK